MKSKDGIKIKPEQEWGLYHFGLEAKVIGFDGPAVVCAYDDGYRDFDCDDFDELSKSHDGADFAAARAEGWTPWTDGMDRPDPRKVETVETWGDAKRWFKPHSDFCSSKNWNHASYRYKLKKEPVGYQAYKDAPDHQDKILPIEIEVEEDYAQDDTENPRLRCFRKLADAEAWLKEDEKPEQETHPLTQAIIDLLPHDLLELAYWDFDSIKKGDGKPSERYAYKQSVRNAIAAAVKGLI